MSRTRSRRRQHSAGAHQHVRIVMPLDMAIQCNQAYPLAGLDAVLYGIRAEVGPHATVSLCAGCASVVVV